MGVEALGFEGLRFREWMDGRRFLFAPCCCRGVPEVDMRASHYCGSLVWREDLQDPIAEEIQYKGMQVLSDIYSRNFGEYSRN